MVNNSDRVVNPTFGVEWIGRIRTGPDAEEHALIVMHEGSVDRALLGGSQAGGIGCSGGGGAIKSIQFTRDVDWVGADSRYFLTAVMPALPREAIAAFHPLPSEGEGTASVGYAAVEIPPGQTVAREYHIYIGPKVEQQLLQTHSSLEASVNLGWSWIAPITRLFSRFLHSIHDYVPNYGWAIILLTLLVRGAMYPLTAKQMRMQKKTSEQMKVLQPRIKEINDKYSDDSTSKKEAMMNLYKETGLIPFAPMAGCLPMLLQFPIFIALFYSLRTSIDLRQEPFMFWITDLSMPATLFTLPGLDLPFRLLPILMGASMALMQKTMPQSGMDPSQQRMMLIMMPVVLTVVCYGFPSGLVLYWVVSNLFGIAQQQILNRKKPAAS